MNEQLFNILSSGMSQLGGAFDAGVPDTDVNNEFMKRHSGLINQMQKADKRQAGFDTGMDALSSAVMAIPGAGTLVGGAMKLASAGIKAFDNAATDDYGIYKNKAWQVADRVTDFLIPFKGIRSAFGKGPSQEELIRARDTSLNIAENNMIRDQRDLGQAMGAALPQYMAPQYG